jgi:hypothetical protein
MPTKRVESFETRETRDEKWERGERKGELSSGHAQYHRAGQNREWRSRRSHGERGGGSKRYHRRSEVLVPSPTGVPTPGLTPTLNETVMGVVRLHPGPQVIETVP